LLADARFVLEPDFERLAAGALGEFLFKRRFEVFLLISRELRRQYVDFRPAL